MTEEYFDVVNENNEAIRRELRRNSGLRHPGVPGFLFPPDRRLLVEKRSQTRDTFPGTLACSVSAHLDPVNLIGQPWFAGKVAGRAHSSHPCGSIRDELSAR